MLFVPLFIINACLIAGLGYLVYSLYDERVKAGTMDLARAQAIIRAEIEEIRTHRPALRSWEEAALAALDPDRV